MFRVFDALNDERNFSTSFQAIREKGVALLRYGDVALRLGRLLLALSTAYILAVSLGLIAFTAAAALRTCAGSRARKTKSSLAAWR